MSRHKRRPTIKPIQTLYKGYLHRSRLEARWAHFLDTLGFGYDYEPQGFDLDGEAYLPDFFVPDRIMPNALIGHPGFWLEVKPTAPSEREMRLAEKLAAATQQLVYILVGDPWLPDARHHVLLLHPLIPGVHPMWHAWAECPECHEVGIAPEGHIFWLLCECKTKFLHTGTDIDGSSIVENLPGFDGPRLMEAYTAARSARFEHGESK